MFLTEIIRTESDGEFSLLNQKQERSSHSQTSKLFIICKKKKNHYLLKKEKKKEKENNNKIETCILSRRKNKLVQIKKTYCMLKVSIVL